MSAVPFFSIITPTYNRESFLEEMIASVAAQTFQDHEHIIVDDGSTDGTEELVKRLMETHPKIVYIKQENKGRSVARNVGIEAAKGEYVCFLDSDDRWNNHYLAELKTNSLGADFLVTKMIWVNGVTGEKTDRPIDGFSSASPQKIIELQIGMNVCVKRSHFSDCCFNEGLSINEDFELWTRMICAKNIDVVAVPQSQYFVTTPEIVGRTTIELLDGMLRAQIMMKTNLAMAERVSPVFWNQRSKGILLQRIRLHEDSDRWALIRSILKFLIFYPKESVNASLAVMLLYNLPGGRLLKKAVAKTKHRGVE